MICPPKIDFTQTDFDLDLFGMKSKLMMTNLFLGPVHFNRPEDLRINCAPRLTSCELFMNDRQSQKYMISLSTKTTCVLLKTDMCLTVHPASKMLPL